MKKTVKLISTNQKSKEKIQNKRILHSPKSVTKIKILQKINQFKI